MEEDEASTEEQILAELKRIRRDIGAIRQWTICFGILYIGGIPIAIVIWALIGVFQSIR